MPFQTLRYEEQDAIGYLTLNRPDRLNALSPTLMAELREALDAIDANPDLRALILTGAGRAFSAGFDIQTEALALAGEPLSSAPPSGEPPSADARRSRLKANIDTFLMIWNLTKPVIAAVNGYALGGACELVQICDIKIASDRAMLGEPEIRLGYGAPLLMTPYSVNLAMAKELLLTGDIIDAREAARIGMVNRVVPHDDLLPECERIARKISRIPAIGVKTTKIAVNRALESAGFLNALNHNLELMTQFDAAQTPEQTEFARIRANQGLRAALQWSRARFDGLD